MTTPNKTPPGADPKQLERTGTVREIGSQAVWSLSSCKPGFGVDQLRDDNLETYWQSDGSQPHLVNIQFRRKTTVKTLCIYADYKSDESYTPSKISVRVGNNFHNLQEIRILGTNNLRTFHEMLVIYCFYTNYFFFLIFLFFTQTTSV
ncbi:anaphase-promoting complex subunit 10 isoform X2 [Leptonychotes weddellii]|uniref:Anaphase-promoting complex subunit 10 n=1 Tax=Leptonychotes weddellii TaxID=9713 RepID=A0A7F8RRC1_LEPWE|nr:anaphase-promoting complex subunit 10 isoform X2 [Leptonychotes weddellii]XP_035935061.1 anaphase-promoting complex subunit 10 isoform X1 [Halichoerus grypus]XP_035935064.1 anaphase-promoting complex subunit 10 isoform X1 [Halichoerus grypus]